MSDTKKMITDDRDFIWDTLYLADELSEEGKFSEFKNAEKAEAFAKKYGMELLDEPFEYLG